MPVNIITFKPKQTTRKLTSVLPERARDVLVSRFGLGESPEKETLESIGNTYGITRERVRQIENFALNAVRKSDVFEEEQSAFGEVYELMMSLGGIVAEDELLSFISPGQGVQNHVYFLLVLGDQFERMREDEYFRHRWSVDPRISEQVHRALHDLHGNLSDEDLIAESDMIKMFADRLRDLESHYYKEGEILKRLLSLSKLIGRNALGDWGLTSSPNIRSRGTRDYAYLAIKQHGSPLHFSEVAKEIEKVFGRPAHVATCHNELIKDKGRFVLVGRGVYALTEWGYSNGIVREVLANILEGHGPMVKDELIKRVLKERYVKENTVLVNLQNRKYFKKDEKGYYSLV